MLRRICIGFICLYSITVAAWWVLHTWLGDSVWWLALLNIFAPYLFLPMVLLPPACLFCRSRLSWLAILPGLIFINLYGHLFLPKQPTSIIAVTGETTADPSLRVMTFNIWGGSQSRKTAHVILDHDSPDIVAIQELTPQISKILEEEFTAGYPYQVLDTRDRFGGMGILSRYPLSRIDTSSLDHPNWRIQVVEVETAPGNFILYNVHFNSTEIMSYLEKELPMGKSIQASFQLRKQLTQTLLNDISRRHRPVILAGDLNSTDQNETYRLLDSLMTDAHRVAGQGFGNTYPAYGGSIFGVPFWPREIRIDMIFYSAEFTALSSQVGTTYGESDHLPMLAQLIWQVKDDSSGDPEASLGSSQYHSEETFHE